MRMSAVRVRTMLVLALLVAGCGVLEPTPEPEPGIRARFGMLVDLGIYPGPPELPPPYATAELDDATTLLLVDRGPVQLLRRTEWTGDVYTPMDAGIRRFDPERLLPDD